MVIIDTNIVIDHLHLQDTKESKLMQLAHQKPKAALAISIISVQELYEGRSTLEPAKEQYLLATIGPLKILAYNYEVAKLAGELARDLKRPIELADAAIAATAILNSASLLTLNRKDFKNIPQLELLEV